MGTWKMEKEYNPLVRYHFFLICNTIIIDVYFDTNWIYFSIIIAQTRAPTIENIVATIYNRDGEGGDIEVDTID